MVLQYGELRPTSGCVGEFGNPCKFQRVSRLGSVTARQCCCLVVGVSQTLRRWTKRASYIRQGGHHVGHWPTFLVKACHCYRILSVLRQGNYASVTSYTKSGCVSQRVLRLGCCRTGIACCLHSEGWPTELCYIWIFACLLAILFKCSF